MFGVILMDKIKILFALFVIAIFVVGCAPPEVEPGAESEAETQPEAEVQPEAEPEPEVVQEMSDELKGVLEKNENVKSFEYRYSGPEEIQIAYSVKGDLIKGSYQSFKKYNDFKYYDIYMNTMDETAYLVCYDVIECKGKKALTVPFEDFDPVTPLEFVRTIEYGVITEHTQVDNKNTVVVSFTNADGNQERVWIWDYWGMPLKREVSVGGEKEIYYYNGLVVNTVLDNKVTMPTDVDLT